VQVDEVKVPVLFVVKVTVPVGVTAPVPDESATVAVQLEALPVFTEAGEQTTVVVVDLMVDVTVKVPALPVCTLSPAYVPVIR
jgi:hypothetical protein